MACSEGLHVRQGAFQLVVNSTRELLVLRADSYTSLLPQWNWVDTISCLGGVTALVMIAFGPAAILTDDLAQFTTDSAALKNEYIQQGVNPVVIKNTLAVALLGCGFKVLYFLRGIEQTAFVINMLDAIISDTAVVVFMLVLLVLLFTFALVYHILLSDAKTVCQDNAGNTTLGSLECNDIGFKTLYRSFITVSYMAFGEVDTEDFWPRSHKNTVGVASPILLFFAFIITIVMLNALIAIMSDTYRAIREVSVAAGLLERATIILELVRHLNQLVK